jgi:hypothetical protein
MVGAGLYARRAHRFVNDYVDVLPALVATGDEEADELARDRLVVLHRPPAVVVDPIARSGDRR